MLLFIVVLYLFQSMYCLISIHLMLLFIPAVFLFPFKIAWFQYISCYCLSYNHNTLPVLPRYFNTSHVTVYHQLALSDSLTDWHFNTSHVTVYLLSLYICHTPFQFQYISCYCLSLLLCYHSLLLFAFQYISCYCLSCLQIVLHSLLLISIHLMLLFIHRAGRWKHRR